LLVERLGRGDVARDLEERMQTRLPGPLLAATPRQFLNALGEAFSRESFALPPGFAEERLHRLLWDAREIRPETRMVLAVLLLYTLLDRYAGWLGTPLDQWYWNKVRDPYCDVSVRGVHAHLEGRLGQWREAPTGELLAGVLNRFVLYQHE